MDTAKEQEIDMVGQKIILDDAWERRCEFIAEGNKKLQSARYLKYDGCFEEAYLLQEEGEKIRMNGELHFAYAIRDAYRITSYLI